MIVWVAAQPQQPQQKPCISISWLCIVNKIHLELADSVMAMPIASWRDFGHSTAECVVVLPFSMKSVAVALQPSVSWHSLPFHIVSVMVTTQLSVWWCYLSERNVSHYSRVCHSIIFPPQLILSHNSQVRVCHGIAIRHDQWFLGRNARNSLDGVTVQSEFFGCHSA